MKQIIISLAVLLSISLKSQNLYVAWETTFDTPAEVAGWQFFDANSNSNTWNVGKHVVRQSSANLYTEISPDHVLRHSQYIPNVTGGPANNISGYNNDYEDWVISPEIDLSGYGGEITLAAMIGRVITYNTTSASNNTSRDVFVYVSTPAKPVPDVSDFQAIRANIIACFNTGAGNCLPSKLSISNADYIAENNALFAQATANLSSYAGQKIYIGFWHNVNNSNRPTGEIIAAPFADTNASNTFQIDEMSVFATEEIQLSITDAKAKTAVTVYPNPTADVLYLKGVSKAQVSVYNAVGQQVLSKAVNNGQINVNELSKGVYTITINNNGKPSTMKFIKK